MREKSGALIGSSPGLGSVVRAAGMVAAADVTALIDGESGTGKELLARHIHDQSPRANGPFVTINCAALPESLAESELFGHRRGSFTGAFDHQRGHVQAASGGTLFFDEVSELPWSIQAKLLRFIETGECQTIGDPVCRKVDVRVISATNRDLYAEVEAGRFRKDLFYRLNVVPLKLPPLRNRSCDIKALMDHFCAMFSETHGLQPPVFNAHAMQKLAEYSWPGNVRELRNFCERMVVLFGGKPVDPENLPRQIQPVSAAAGFPEGLLAMLDSGLGLDGLEKRLIREALHKAGGNRSKAARLLGITRDTLLYRIKKYALA